jgi:hypothetical protein
LQNPVGLKKGDHCKPNVKAVGKEYRTDGFRNVVEGLFGSKFVMLGETHILQILEVMLWIAKFSSVLGRSTIHFVSPSVQSLLPQSSV